MAASNDFEQDDRFAATNAAGAARRAGVGRIIYLGGVGDEQAPDRSPHLRSRHEVGRIFRHSGVETVELRASVVIGAGSLSFTLMQSSCDRLPVMLCPKWLTTPTQPIAVDDVLAYLLAASDLAAGESRVIEVGGSDVVSDGGMSGSTPGSGACSAADLDLVSVHLYPESGKVDEALETLAGFATAGKPVLVEETFPLKCLPAEPGQFIDRSKEHAAGWVGFYWGKTPEELRRSTEIRDAMMLQRLDVFARRARPAGSRSTVGDQPVGHCPGGV